MTENFIHTEGILSREHRLLVQLILDLFSEATGQVLAYYDPEGNTGWCSGDEVFSPLCRYLKGQTNLWQLCEDDHKRRTSAEYFGKKNKQTFDICHLGLWNISHPIYVNGRFYGSLLTGQKKLSAKDKLDASEKQLVQRLSELKNNGLISDAIELKIKNYFNKVDIIDNFQTDILSRLITIETRLGLTVDILLGSTDLPLGGFWNSVMSKYGWETIFPFASV